jgi:hypothetical protein
MNHIKGLSASKVKLNTAGIHIKKNSCLSFREPKEQPYIMARPNY